MNPTFLRGRIAPLHRAALGPVLFLLLLLASIGSAARAQVDATTIDPAVAEIYNQGLEAATSADFPLAKERFQEAISREPEFLEAHYNLGLVLQNLGDYANAAESFRKALELDPQHLAAQRLLADALAQQGAFAEAVPAYERAIEMDTTRPQLYYSYAEALSRLPSKEADKVLAAFETALARGPDHPSAYAALLSLASEAMQAKKHDRAIRAYDRAIQMRPDNAAAHYNRGIALKRAGKLQESIQSFEKASELKPPYGQAHYVIAGIYYNDLKNDAKALEHYDAAAQDPDFKDKAKAQQYADSIRDYLEKKAAQEAQQSGGNP